MTEANPLARSHDLLWNGLPEPKRGPKPTHALEQIVSTAIALADAEGLDGLSMRKLAVALEMGTMSLYRYVPGKPELLNLMLDRVIAPGDDAGPLGADWREVLTTSAHQGRALYLTHRWLLQVNWTRPVLGPNSLADLERTMAGLVDMPFDDREKMMLLTLLDSFVTGTVRQEVLYDLAAAESGITDEEFWNYQLPVLQRAMESGAYPTMAAMAEDSFDAGWDETFIFGLERFLDGIELEVERRRDRGVRA